MNELDIDLIQATMWPGDTLAGVVRIEGPGDPLVHLTFQGEEVLSASSIAMSVVPFFELSATLDCSSGPADFHFALPPELPPSYFSTDLRCHYVLKARRKGAAAGLIPGFRRDAIKSIQIPVLPTEDRESSEQHWCVLQAGGAELELRLDSVAIEAGTSLTGELLLKRVSDGPLPTELTFRFASIEEVTKKGHFHRKVTSLQTHEVKPEEGMEYPIGGFFEFPLPADSPTSGDWHTFRVHYGFRVGVTLPDGTQNRESMPIRVFRYPRELPDPDRPLGLTPSAEH